MIANRMTTGLSKGASRYVGRSESKLRSSGSQTETIVPSLLLRKMNEARKYITRMKARGQSLRAMAEIRFFLWWGDRGAPSRSIDSTGLYWGELERLVGCWNIEGIARAGCGGRETRVPFLPARIVSTVLIWIIFDSPMVFPAFSAWLFLKMEHISCRYTLHVEGINTRRISYRIK